MVKLCDINSFISILLILFFIPFLMIFKLLKKKFGNKSFYKNIYKNNWEEYIDCGLSSNNEVCYTKHKF